MSAHAPSGEGARPVATQRRGLMSPLTWKILAVNAVALAVLVGALLYLGRYRQELVEAELDNMTTQAEMYAAAISAAAVGGGDGPRQQVRQEVAVDMIRRLVAVGDARARLFAPNGQLIADSRRLGLRGRGVVAVEPLPLPVPELGWFGEWMRRATDAVLGLLQGERAVPVYQEADRATIGGLSEVRAALNGYTQAVLRRDAEGRRYLSVAVPVQRFKRVLGAIMLTKRGDEIEAALHAVRLDILKVFFVALVITVLLSLYLAGAITAPLHRLARAAEQVRRAKTRRVAIPDLSARGDEIGDLSRALREMTAALWDRMDAIERFAADVAHEIKNPLTSLRSAVETAARLEDPVRRDRLMEVVLQDVERLDLLISDISDYSRMDAEMSRAEKESVDLVAMLETLADVYNTDPDAAPVRIEAPGPLPVPMVEARIVQVLRNLIINARSFSPKAGTVRVRLQRDGAVVVVRVADDGPGVAPGKEEKIFERFYTERSNGESFGRHSGLGLSISRQIARAHGGELRATNRHDAAGAVIGAEFILTLPAA